MVGTYVPDHQKPQIRDWTPYLADCQISGVKYMAPEQELYRDYPGHEAVHPNSSYRVCFGDATTACIYILRNECNNLQASDGAFVWTYVNFSSSSLRFGTCAPSMSKYKQRHGIHFHTLGFCAQVIIQTRDIRRIRYEEKRETHQLQLPLIVGVSTHLVVDIHEELCQA
ncbi:hypothetical protein ARMSODRAFT_290851 [Armillaria solidipes]|uniref:Uncharacterized protein n=1 Tax=Armillaria solidipes TaxID=1076256 RepID=A0A2H3BPE9_9AGAR|nr:hypothetical protein ARMSODRAFT_290851 [Armillaria solidipes]